jgi:hypothetical protein
LNIAFAAEGFGLESASIAPNDGFVTIAGRYLNLGDCRHVSRSEKHESKINFRPPSTSNGTPVADFFACSRREI